MAATDAMALPIKANAFRFYFGLRKSADNTRLTNWAGASASAQKSIDGAVFAACTNAPVEIPVSGIGYIDFTAAEMTSSCTTVLVTATGGVDFMYFIYPGAVQQIWNQPDFGDAAGKATTVGQQLAQFWRRYFNKVSDDGNSMIIYKDDSITQLATMAIGTGPSSKGRGY